MQSTQPEFEIVDSKKNKVILYDNYRFVVNKKPNIRFILDVLRNVV